MWLRTTFKVLSQRSGLAFWLTPQGKPIEVPFHTMPTPEVMQEIENQPDMSADEIKNISHGKGIVDCLVSHGWVRVRLDSRLNIIITTLGDSTVAAENLRRFIRGNIDSDVYYRMDFWSPTFKGELRTRKFLREQG